MKTKIVKRALREPLLHFLVLGAGLFLAYGMAPKQGGGRDAARILITRGQVEQLAAGFAKTWQRPPSPDELAGLVRDRVREEVYYREAVALGLDKDDTVIRRRLRQKMEFISDDVAAQAEPTDDELAAYLQAHPDSFRVEPRFTFRHVYLDPDRHGAHLAEDVAQLLARLRQGAGEVDFAELGDASMMERQFVALPTREIAKLFGETFASSLATLATGQWQGPVESGYGVHLVYVAERTQARLPELAEVRDAVRREWNNARRLESNEEFYQQLLKRYSVSIEGLDVAEQDNRLAAKQPK